MIKNGKYKNIISDFYIIVNIIISCIIISGFIGCNISVIEEIIEEPEIIIIEEIEEMELKPIKEFANYFIAESGNIFGVENDTIEGPFLLEDTDGHLYTPKHFGIVDGKIVIAINVLEEWYYFEQKDGVMKSCEDIPAFTVPETIELDEPPFKIVSGKYNDMDISTVSQKIEMDTPSIAYLPITGAIVNELGLWYNVPETFGTREAGLYFWYVGGNARMVLAKGRLW